MPAPKSADPLIPLPCRLPKTTVERLRAEAAAAGVSVSDVLRSHLTLAEAKPLGKPSPRRREKKKLAAVSGADPDLLRALASIGNNLNQLARAVNTGAVAGKPIECIQALAIMRAMEQELMKLGKARAY